MSLDPEYYKKTPKENFNVNNDLEDIMKSWDNLVPDQDWPPLKEFIHECLRLEIDTPKKLQKAFISLRRKHRRVFKKNNVLHVLKAMENRQELSSFSSDKVHLLKSLLVKKAKKSTSGVLVVTVFTSPYPEVNGKKQEFTCEWNCYYCPNEPGQPRSYLHDEPGVLRANRNNFDAVLQFYDRTMTLSMNGHPVDKIELLILGGTWSSYPINYQEEFIRDLFYAANTFFEQTKRNRLSLTKEKELNEIAKCKIIGITLETRPDCICPDEIKRYRYYGCTRVQLGIQHTDDRILKKINRDCYRADTARALKLLKDSCYKIDIHIMPNLPGATVEGDKVMFDDILSSPELQADQWKIYPCEVVPWTIIQKWYESGEYKPYDESDLMSVLKYALSKVHPWIRLNRIVRDIPSQYILGGVNKPNMRQDVAKLMAEEGIPCRCIRTREVHDKTELTAQAVLKVRRYFASDGLEYFISFETEDESTIFGFVRLRIPAHCLELEDYPGLIPEIEAEGGIKLKGETTRASRSKYRARTIQRVRRRSKTPSSAVNEHTDVSSFFPELRYSALIRELHVYGQLVPALQGLQNNSKQQHVGFGTRLMNKADDIARKYKKVKKISVISGVGVRNFYRKLGYHLEGDSEMMIKPLSKTIQLQFIIPILVLMLAFVFTYFQFNG